MAHGLEVRVPLVDSRLLEAVAPIILQGGARQGKKALIAASQVALPKAVVTRAKTGFTTPIASWLQRVPGQRYAEVPMLAAPNCRWGRRWAYCVAGNKDAASLAGLEGFAA
jgi:asparagine synthase (glutamine-hydrolysing)